MVDLNRVFLVIFFKMDGYRRMRTALFIFTFLYCADVALAEEAATQSAALLGGLFGDIPVGTITWVLAALAFLNAVSELLERLETKLRSFADKTKTQVDDKALRWLELTTNVLQGFLKFAHITIDFFAAKGKVRK